MADFSISQFTQKVQDFINQNKIDKNGDGRINEANGELAELLSGQNVNNVEELLMTDSVHFAKPKRVLPPNIEAVLKIKENYYQAVDKYNALSDMEKNEINTRAELEMIDKFRNLYAKLNQLKIFEPLTQQIGNSGTKGTIGTLASSYANKAVETMRANIRDNDTAFIDYNVLYKSIYQTSGFMMPMGGSYTIADKLDYDCKQLIQEYDALDENSMSGADFKKATEEFLTELENLVDEAGKEVEERTENLLNEYREEMKYSIESLENNRQVEIADEVKEALNISSDNAPDLKGTVALMTFAESVDTTTGMKSTKTEPEKANVKKYVENGKVIIERDGVKYNVNGTRVE